MLETRSQAVKDNAFDQSRILNNTISIKNLAKFATHIKTEHYYM